MIRACLCMGRVHTQACRLPYGLIVDGALRELGDVRYLLSPQDLMAVEQVCMAGPDTRTRTRGQDGSKHGWGTLPREAPRRLPTSVAS
jgi:hypothetical protein